MAVTKLQPFLSDRPFPLSFAQIRQLSPTALAYLGDAVYELYVRSQCLLPPSRLHTYHQRVVSHVRAETQADYATVLRPHLTDSELTVFNQGRNSASSGPKRINPATYQQATGLETLIGYLYLTDPQRLQELLKRLEINRLLTHPP